MLSWWIALRLSQSLRTDAFARFTSIVSIASVALGTLALIVSISILDGYEERILETATRYTSHVEIRSKNPEGLHLTKAEMQSIKALDDVVLVSPIIIRESLARTRHGVDGVAIHGMESSRIERLLAPAITAGDQPTGDDCLVGAEIARRLNLRVGDTLLLYTASQPDYENVGDQLHVLIASKVSGLVTTGMQSVDAGLVAMRMDALQRATHASADGATMLAIELRDPERADRVALRLLTMLPRDNMIYTWKARYAGVAGWIELQKKPIPVVLGLISIVAVFTLLSTLLVSVVLKTRSLAILSALGSAPGALMLVVLFRGLRLSITGSVIGMAVAFVFAYVQHTWSPIALDGAIYYVSTLPVSLAPAPYLIILLITLALSVCASVVPMVVARRVRVTEALRFG
jgi:lipoprotein-releasing system permease protein